MTEQPKPQTTRKGGVSENGALHVDGTQLMNENNEPVVLHGMSSHVCNGLVISRPKMLLKQLPITVQTCSDVQCTPMRVDI